MFVDNETFRGLATPVRVIDSRDDSDGKFPAGPSDWVGLIREATPLPDGLVGAVAINVTVTNAEGDGYITFYPGDEVPPTSSISFSAGTTVANTGLVGTDNIGNVNFHIESTGPIDVIVDVTGWYPQDTFGLIAEARFARYYGTGVDRVGVIVCESPEHRIDPATVMSNLNIYVAPWFATESGGGYSQQYVYLGEMRGRSGTTGAAPPPSVGLRGEQPSLE